MPHIIISMKPQYHESPPFAAETGIFRCLQVFTREASSSSSSRCQAGVSSLLMAQKSPLQTRVLNPNIPRPPTQLQLLRQENHPTSCQLPSWHSPPTHPAHRWHHHHADHYKHLEAVEKPLTKDRKAETHQKRNFCFLLCNVLLHHVLRHMIVAVHSFRHFLIDFFHHVLHVVFCHSVSFCPVGI